MVETKAGTEMVKHVKNHLYGIVGHCISVVAFKAVVFWYCLAMILTGDKSVFKINIIEYTVQL